MLDYPACNFVIHSSPFGESNNDYYHWHVELMPKLVRVAGFEWGTGFYINLTPPEEFAKLLREGWDTPNVFQICALRDIRTERERRQTIGRGLRLCVNQEGERLRGFGVNTLTVIATESYEEFAENLQREIEKDTGIRFGVVEAHQFAAIPVTGDDGRKTALGFEASKVLWEYLNAKGYIDAKGRIQDSLRKALKRKTFSVPFAQTILALSPLDRTTSPLGA